MGKNDTIRDANIRTIDVFKRRPQVALSTDKGMAVVEDGLSCTFIQGDNTAVMDMPEIRGGDATGPTPGFFSRAGIAGCVCIGIKMAAATAGLAFDKVTVGIETDFDDGAAFGLGDASAAPLETRLAITIETGVPDDEVVALVDNVLGMDPWYLALRDAQAVKTRIVVEG